MSISKQYLEKIIGHLTTICEEEHENILQAAGVLAEQIRQDKLIHVVGPGGHSNLATQEVFFRAGGLMHINPILDEGTLLSNGALRSMAIERLPGYGRTVFQNHNINPGDVLILANAYGINSAVIDIALCAQENSITLIGVTSVLHAKETATDHPARHPSKKNLYELADIVLDSKVEVGDAVMEIEGMTQKVAAMSTFASAYLLQSLVAETVQILVSSGIEPPIWRSGNAPGGDEWNNQFIDRFKGRIVSL